MIKKHTVSAIEICVLISKRQNTMSCSTGELAKALGLSISYVEMIVKQLKSHQIVCSFKGPGGGYKILGNLERVSIWQIAEIFESETRSDQTQTNAAIQDFERALQETIQATFKKFTLADFSEPVLEPYKAPQNYSRFKFKPMSQPWLPKAPNSVFQLHMHS